MSPDSVPGPKIGSHQWAENLDALAPGAKQPTPIRIPLPWLFTMNHRIIGIQYLLLSLVAVAAGTILSLVMRIHLVWPDLALPFFGQVKPEDYLALVTMHGTLMVFFVLTTAPLSGFANLVLPEQIGSNRMALPTMNAISFWLTALALIVLVAAFIVPGGAPISGWTSYPPLSAIASAGPGQALGMDMWLISIAIFCIASWIGSVNILATIVGERCEGMILSRMPLTVWSWLVSSLLVLVSFSVLLAALLDALLGPPSRHQLLSFLWATSSPDTSALTAMDRRCSGCISSGFSAIPRSTSPSFPEWVLLRRYLQISADALFSPIR